MAGSSRRMKKMKYGIALWLDGGFGDRNTGRHERARKEESPCPAFKAASKDDLQLQSPGHWRLRCLRHRVGCAGPGLCLLDFWPTRAQCNESVAKRVISHVAFCEAARNCRQVLEAFVA